MSNDLKKILRVSKGKKFRHTLRWRLGAPARAVFPKRNMLGRMWKLKHFHKLLSEFKLV